MPNSYVNDDGKPNLDNSNADNENEARVSVRSEGDNQLGQALAPAADLAAGVGQACLEFEQIRFVGQLELQYGAQQQGSQFGTGVGLDQMGGFHGLGCMLGQQQCRERCLQVADGRFAERVAVSLIDLGIELGCFFVYFERDAND